MRPRAEARDAAAAARRRAMAVAALLGLSACAAKPGGTPPPPENSGLFTDFYAWSGVQVGGMTWPLKVGPVNAAALSDCDGDGLPDAFVFNWPDSGRLWHNLGHFQFQDITAASGISAENANAAAFGDLDNDGLPDLIVAFGSAALAEYFQTGRKPLQMEIRVYHNDGGCHFTDVSTAWGFGPRSDGSLSFISGFELADINLDGRLDVLVSRVEDGSSPVWTYISQPDGTWLDQADALFGPQKGSQWSNFMTDVDGDGLADLFELFDGRNGPPAVYLHRVSPPSPVKFEQDVFDPRLFGADAGPASLMGGATADIDGDGTLAVCLTDIGPQHVYTHQSMMTDVAAALGVAAATNVDGSPSVAWGASFLDYDNDTWPDLAMVRGVDDGYWSPTGPVLFHNRGAGTFEDKTSLLDMPLQYTEGWIGVADLDRDGRADLWLGGEKENPKILRNETPAGKSFAVRLRGHTSNAEGVGSNVAVTVGGRKLVQEMYANTGPWGYGEERLIFGLGTAAQADGIEVRWPSGYVQQYGKAAAGSEVVIEEPALIQLAAPVLAEGASASIVVSPAAPDGSLLGSGHVVTVVMDPGAVALTMTDSGKGAYSATTTALAAGLYGFTVSIDGTALFAHPQVLVH